MKQKNRNQEGFIKKLLSLCTIRIKKAGSHVKIPAKPIAIALLILSMTLLASATVRITDSSLNVSNEEIWKSVECVLDAEHGDQTGIQACIDSIDSGDIKIRSANYNIGTTINITKSDISIECAEGTILNLTAANIYIFRVNANLGNISITNCQWNLNNLGGGIRGVNFSNSRIQYNTIYESKGGFEPIYCQGDGCDYNTFSDNHFENNRWYSVRIQDGDYNYVERNTCINQSNHCIDITWNYTSRCCTPDGNKVNDNIIDTVVGSTANAITFYCGESPNFCKDNEANDNWIYDTGAHGISFDGKHLRPTAKDNHCINTGANCVSSYGSHNGSFSSNDCYGGATCVYLSESGALGGGINATSSKDNLVELNNAWGMTGTPFNIRRAYNLTGITVDGNIIRFNYVRDCAGTFYAIAVNSYNGSVTNTLVEYNEVRNCPLGFYDNGINTTHEQYNPATGYHKSTRSLNLTGDVLVSGDVNVSGSFNGVGTGLTGTASGLNVNLSDNWDELDSPTDIDTLGDITTGNTIVNNLTIDGGNFTLNYVGNNIGAWFFTNTGSSANEHFFQVVCENSAFDKYCGYFKNDGTARGMYWDCNGGGICNEFDGESNTNPTLKVHDSPFNVSVETQAGDKICLNGSGCTDFVSSDDISIGGDISGFTISATTLSVTDYGLVEDDIPALSSTWDNTLDADRLVGLDFLNDKVTIQGENVSGGTIEGVTFGVINLGNGNTNTIDDCNITITNSYHELETEGGSANDDLCCVKGGQQGDIIYLTQLDNNHDVLYKNGNCSTSSYRMYIDGGDFPSGGATDTLHCIHVGNYWSCMPIGR